LNEEEIKTQFFSQQLVAVFAKLNMLQLRSVLEAVICSALDKSKDLHLEKSSVDLQGPSFPLDLQSKVYWATQAQDYWKIKLLLAQLCNSKRTEDAQVRTLPSDLKNILCKQLCELILVDNQLGEVKHSVKLTHPGENTMFPFLHCRGCGLIKAIKFRMCSMCKECPEYHDQNYFCSAECELEALDKQHREEHARFFMVQLNMD
jgi:hypothetical protein